MNRRWLALPGMLALALAAPQTAGAAVGSSAAQHATARRAPRTAAPTDRHAAVERGLDRLRSVANGRLRVHRARDGAVDFVSSTDGRAMVDAKAIDSPRRSAVEQLARYGAAFGIDGDTSRAVVTSTLPSATGGSVVRSQQVVDDVPVFGGQVVMSLDADQGVVSADAATTGATEVPAPRVSEARARLVALAATAKAHRIPVARLAATDQGRALYDPAIVHTTDPLGVRPVWQFEVTGWSDVRETVLVGTGGGEVALHFDNNAGLNRRICDNGDKQTVSSSARVPICATPARIEGGSAGGTDVQAAYANLGATSDAYAALDDIDLTKRIGYTSGGSTSLASTVRWCFSDDGCPYPNAFWDGRQMVFGRGYAKADDVVGHELTHGYVERTAGLFYLHQSGALNESLADTIGEIVDHRNPGSAADDSAWNVGEDLGVAAATRSMKDPTIHKQPDKMTSPFFRSTDAQDDDGAVHVNDGVGNKTAYLISQGGNFNGQSITGIDASDPGLAKTGRLYLETIPRLTSGAEYADLGRVLVTTCDSLVASGTGGFTTGDCGAVRAAVTATELSSAPTNAAGAAAEAPISCPSGSTETVLGRDDDGVHELGLASSSPLWGSAPSKLVPSYAVSGTESRFGLDPDPRLGDPASGTLTSAPFTVPVTSGGTFLNFHHAYVLDFVGTTYYDGGRVIVSRLANDVWTPVSGLPWVNGPTRHVRGSTSAGFLGFGGDSHGYGSSQVDLSSLAGQRVKVEFRLEGDVSISDLGWWIDDVRLYGCDTGAIPSAGLVAPTAPRSVALKAAATSAVVSWGAPSDQGSTPIHSYEVTRPDGTVLTLPGSSRSVTLTGLDATRIQTVTVLAKNADAPGPATTVRAYPTTSQVSSSVTRAKANRAFTLTAKVLRRGSTAVIRSMPVVLQRKVSGQTAWHTLSSGTTGSRGTKAWSVRLSRTTAYRVVAKGVGHDFGSVSAPRTVRRR